MNLKRITLAGLVTVFTACGEAESPGTSLKMNVKFVDAGSVKLKSQAVFPEGVEVVHIEVCEIFESGSVPADPCIGPVDIPKGSGKTSYTFTGLLADRTYNVEIWTENSEGIITYWGGTTVTLQVGENVVNVVAVRLPWRNAAELIQMKPPLSLCFIFYDPVNSVYDFSFDSSFFENIGFPAEAKNLVVYQPVGDFEIISGGADNGATYTDLQLIPIYDDGLHYDGLAGDGKWNMRLRYIPGGGGVPIGAITYKVMDPFGNNFYSYEPCNQYPIIYKSGRLDIPAQAITDNGDDVWVEGEGVTVTHNLTGGDYAVFVFFENSSNPVDFSNLSESEDVFRQIAFSSAGRIPYTDYGLTSPGISFLNSDILSWITEVDPRAYGFDQMRFVVVDHTNGQWQVSNPIRFSF